MIPTKEKAAYKISEIAEGVALSEKTIRSLISYGKITAIKVGGSVRIPHSELEKILSGSLR